MHAFHSYKDLKGNLGQLYFLNEHGDLYFFIADFRPLNCRKQSGKVSNKLCQLIFLGNHLKFVPNFREKIPQQNSYLCISRQVFQTLSSCYTVKVIRINEFSGIKGFFKCSFWLLITQFHGFHLPLTGWQLSGLITVLEQKVCF